MVLGFLQDETRRFRTIEVYCGIVFSRGSAKREEPSHIRLKDMVRSFWNFHARRDARSAQGTVVKKKEMASIAAAKENKEVALNGSEGQCSKGDACSFMRDENKKG